MEEIYNDDNYKEWILEIIAYCQSYGYKVGISTKSWSLPLSNDFYNASDVIFPNLYPSLGTRRDKTTHDDVINALQQADRIQKIRRCKELNPSKPIIVNEIGVQDYWIALQAPETYSWNSKDMTATNGAAPNKLLTGIFETLNKDYIEEVWWWYDLYYDTTKSTCLKYLKGVIE